MPSPAISDPEFTWETEHLKIDKGAYDRLVHEAVTEVIRCLFVNHPPSRITMEKVRDHIRVFAGSNLEVWTRPLNVIDHKIGSGDAHSDTLRAEHQQLVRVVRTCLKDQLVHQENLQVWQEACAKAVNRAKYAIFRVQESSVYLHRLALDHRYEQYS